MINFTIDTALEKESDYIDDEIVKFNSKKVTFTQDNPFEKINYVAKSDQSKIVGGINSVLYCWKILYIDILWVNDSYRTQGIGSHLIKKVEEVAKQKGCHLIHLDTFDWQAKEFYLKHGYEIFGVLDDCPKGHKRFYMKKIIHDKIDDDN